MSVRIWAGLFVVASGFVGCAPANAPLDSEELTEDANVVGEGLTGPIAAGSQLRTTGNLNLRSGPSSSSGVVRVVPKGAMVTVVSSQPTNGFYRIDHDGTTGYSYGSYLEPIGSTVGGLPAGSALKATSDVNLRSGASTSHSVITVVPEGGQVTLLSPDPTSGFYNVKYGSSSGWSSSKYYDLLSSPGEEEPTNPPTGSDPPADAPTSKVGVAMQRAEVGVGHSYWWGHGRFREGGPGSQGGSCSGACPSCSHSGSYGGDCSGFVAKVWQVPSSNAKMSVDSHPYTTADFNSSSSEWSIISRSNIKQADAMNYRSGGSGHVFIYSKGDPWGSIYAYECKNCKGGCVKGYRTASSAYKAVRRKGF